MCVEWRGHRPCVSSKAANVAAAAGILLGGSVDRWQFELSESYLRKTELKYLVSKVCRNEKSVLTGWGQPFEQARAGYRSIHGGLGLCKLVTYNPDSASMVLNS